jgi:hypothetical protein
MRQLRLPQRFLHHSVCHVVPQYLGLISRVRSPTQGNRRADARVLVDRCHPLAPVFCPKDAFGSPKFPANSFDLCPALGPRTVPCARSSVSARMWSPQLLPRRHRPVMTFEALSHGFSHGCLRFVPSSRTTTQNSLPVADLPSRVGFFHPHRVRLESFTLSRSPLPGLLLARSSSHYGDVWKLCRHHFVDHFVEKSNMS